MDGTMSMLEPRNVAEVAPIENDADFRDFMSREPKGLLIVSEPYGDANALAMRESAGDFARWLKLQSPAIPVQIRQADDRLVLRCGDYWLPLVFLASDVALPVYLNLVASYIYDKMKGALKSDKTRVRLSAVFEAEDGRITKRFDFDGDAESLAETIRRFDLNRFLDE
jgi:hypothetical protein